MRMESEYPMKIPRPEHPRPDRMREHWLNLNGPWDFALCDEKQPGDVVYDRVITVPFSWAAPLSGVAQDVKGAGWYRRAVSFTPPEGWRVFLCVGAADYRAEVYVNGNLTGGHIGGYAPFEFDVTPTWRAGDNSLVIRVEDTDDESQTRGKQGYGEIRGIWQTVWLEARPQAYIEALRVETRQDDEAIFTLTTLSPHAFETQLTLDFGQGAQRKLDVRVPEGRRTIQASLRVDGAHRWSPDHPHLYEGGVTLGEDTIGTYFGLRTIEARAFGVRDFPWIALNGKPVYLNGTLDQSFHPEGFFTLPDESDVMAEVQRMKDIGLNFVRVHIKPEEPRKIYWMDKLGVMLMEDMPCCWGDPTPENRAAWEAEAFEVMARDVNHPCLISWVLFNETWGLRSNVDGVYAYRSETQEWVRAMVKKTKAFDPTRLVEDHSVCNGDHVETDINSYHYYVNGYGTLRDYLRRFCDATAAGSRHNYIGENKQAENTPLMNSECGMVWGVDGGAGDSDLAWQYKYMLNQMRLHEKMCGFVFTEFHDVINEWNGYYRIDNGRKFFGYDGMMPGMRLNDLHAQAMPCIDAPPCRTLGAGEAADVPVRISNFSAKLAGKPAVLRLSLDYDGVSGRVQGWRGEVAVVMPLGLGEAQLVTLRMPEVPAVAIFGVAIELEGQVLSRNYINFDVRAPLKDAVSVRPKDAASSSWRHHWPALSGEKFCGANAGWNQYDIDLTPLARAHGTSVQLEVVFEAGAKQVLRKDRGNIDHPSADADFMHGYRQDPGESPNSYPMTDEVLHPSAIALYADGQHVVDFTLPDDPADARGVLSWHYQRADRLLDEAGSYGCLCAARLPEALCKKLLEKGGVSLRVEAKEQPGGGVALYGRNSGRYPIDIIVRAV